MKNIIKKLSLILTACLIVTAIPVFADRNEGTVTSTVTNAQKLQVPYGYDTILTQGKDDSYYHVTWSSDRQNADYLQWVESDRVENGVFPSDCYTDEADMADGVCRAKMTDLKSNTAYAYRVGNALYGWSEIYYTSAKDKDDKSFSFLMVGDPQPNSDVDGENWNLSLNKAKNWFGDEIEFIISLGDQTNAGNDESQFDDFMYPELLRTTPLVTIVGNHDNRAANYSRHFTYTDIDPNTVSDAGKYSGNYWVEYDGMLIIVLNVQLDSIATHIAYTEKAIEEYTAVHGEPLWTVVAYHDSLFSAADSRYNETWERRDTYSTAFSTLGVDAVLQGHDHIYTRTYMINGTDIIDDASIYTQVGNDPYGSIVDPKEGDVVYLTANSSSGSKFYEITDKQVPFAACSNQENVPNITKIDVTSDSMEIYTYRTGPDNEIGDLMDFFAIRRSSDTDKCAPTISVPRTTYFYTDDVPDLSEGVSAYDSVDGDVSEKIGYSGTIDLLAPSVITYTVTDNAGNTATVERVMIPINEEKLISTENTVWKYLDNGSWPFDFDDGYDEYRWITERFDDSEWKETVGSFGSINGELAEHSAGVPDNLLEMYFPEGHDDEGFNIPNFFFRTTFNVADPENVEKLLFDIWFDDAVIIYLNGIEVKRYNCFTGGLNTGYSGSERDSTEKDATSQYLTFAVDDKTVLNSLREEGNLLAVELFQGNMSSDDIYFELGSIRAQRTASALPFKDVKTSHWYYQSVTRAYQKGLFVGTSDTEFSPNGTTTRAMAWAVLSRISGADAFANNGHWYDGYRDWAVENGVSDGTYPNNSITREQLVSMLYRLKDSPGVEGNLDNFADSAKVSVWAKDAMLWAVNEGLVVGRGSELAPRANATRAEACVLLLKYLEVK